MLKKMFVSLVVCACFAKVYAAPAIADRDVNCVAYLNSMLVLAMEKTKEVENSGGNSIGYQVIILRGRDAMGHHLGLFKKKITDKKLDSEDVDNSLGKLVSKYNSELEAFSNDPAALFKELISKEKSLKCSSK